MRLGYVTASLPYGVSESFFLSELRALTELGVEVVVFPLRRRGRLRPEWDQDSTAPCVRGSGLLSAPVLAATTSIMAQYPLRTAGSISPILRRPWHHLLKNLAVVPKALWLARELERNGCDHLHVHWGGTTASAGMIAASIAHVPWSLTCHRWDIYENNLLREKVASSAFTRFISERGRQDAIALGAPTARTRVIPLGVTIPPLDTCVPWPRREPFTLLSPANLIPVKGHQYLLGAMRQLVGSGADVRLLLAGDGPLQGELEAEATRMGIAGRVDFLGQVSHARILEMYARRAVHATVLSSVDLGGGLHEGVPVSLMEAMAYGVPVVSTTTGSIPELLPPSMGLTVPDKDEGALASALHALVSSEDVHQRAARACRDRIATGWDIARSVATLVKEIEQTAG